MNDLERADPPPPFLLFFFLIVQVQQTWERKPGRDFFFFLVGWALRLAPMQPKSSGSSRFPVNILTNLTSLPRYVACRFVVKVTQGNGRGGVMYKKREKGVALRVSAAPDRRSVLLF